jgi:hypothetical protein
MINFEMIIQVKYEMHFSSFRLQLVCVVSLVSHQFLLCTLAIIIYLSHEFTKIGTSAVDRLLYIP